MSPSFREPYFIGIIWSTIMEDVFLVDVPGIAPEPVFDLAMQTRPAAAMSSYLTGERSCLRPYCRFSPACERLFGSGFLLPLPLSLYRGDVYKTIQDFVF